MKDARKSWGEGDVRQEKKTEGSESKHRMKETGDSIIGQITEARQELTARDIQQPGTGCKISLIDSTPGLCRASGAWRRREKIRGETYVSVHQLAVVLHLVSAVLVGDVALLGVLVNVGRQFLPLVVVGGGENIQHVKWFKTNSCD